MANFELIGYIKSVMYLNGQPRITIGEYVQGRKNAETGEIEGEKTDLWFVFFPKSSKRHIQNFKPNDLVMVKGTIHQSLPNSEYAYCVNGENIKHFYTRNLIKEDKLFDVSQKAIDNTGERPDLDNFLETDF